MGNIRRTYSPEFKLRAVKMYLEEHKGVIGITRELGLPDTKHVRRWVKAYQELGEAGLQEREVNTTVQGEGVYDLLRCRSSRNY